MNLAIHGLRTDHNLETRQEKYVLLQRTINDLIKITETDYSFSQVSRNQALDNLRDLRSKVYKSKVSELLTKNDSILDEQISKHNNFYLTNKLRRELDELIKETTINT